MDPLKDFQPVISPPALKRKIRDHRTRYYFPLQAWETIVSSEIDEKTEEKFPYLVVIKASKAEGVKYILAEDEEFIYIQYGLDHEGESHTSPLDKADEMSTNLEERLKDFPKVDGVSV